MLSPITAFRNAQMASPRVRRKPQEEEVDDDATSDVDGSDSPRSSHSVASGIASPRPVGCHVGWQQPTILTLLRSTTVNPDLGVTLCDHDTPDSPGVKVLSVEEEGRCAQAGMLAGSALISVCGKRVKSHHHAIELLEYESKRRDIGAEVSLFKVVVQEQGRTAENRAVVQCL